jgi:hypothetical protein
MMLDERWGSSAECSASFDQRLLQTIYMELLLMMPLLELEHKQIFCCF